MDRLLTTWRFHAVVVAITTVLILIVYSNTFDAAFQFDDIHRITENPAIHNPENLWRVFKEKRGLTMATFLINYAAGGTDTTGYHAVNTAIHIINSALAYAFVLMALGMAGLGNTRARVVAFFATLLFALHPLQTQSVTYIVQRMESLSALFSLASLIVFMKAAGTAGTVRRYALYLLVGVLFALAFHAKEVAFTLPALILLFDFCFVARGRLLGGGVERPDDARGPLIGRWPLYALLSALFLYFTFTTVIPVGGFSDLSSESAVTAAAPAEAAPGARQGPKIRKQFDITAGFGYKDITPGEYLMTQFNVIVYYMTLLVYPANQNLDYDFPITVGFFKAPLTREGTTLNYPIPPPAVSFALLLAMAGASAFTLLRSLKSGSPAGRAAPFFVFWFLIILSPTSSFIPIADVIFEHRLYLPSLGFFVIYALLLEGLFTRILCRGRA